MSIQVSVRALRDVTDNLLRRVEEGERVVVTRCGKPVADLVPHKEESGRWLTPAEVMEIREIASADPTWAADLAKLREETMEDLDPMRWVLVARATLDARLNRRQRVWSGSDPATGAVVLLFLSVA